MSGSVNQPAGQQANRPRPACSLLGLGAVVKTAPPRRSCAANEVGNSDACAPRQLHTIGLYATHFPRCIPSYTRSSQMRLSA